MLENTTSASSIRPRAVEYRVSTRGAVITGVLLATVAAALCAPNDAVPFSTMVIVHAVVLAVGAMISARRRRSLIIDGLFVFLTLDWLRGCLVPLLVQYVGQVAPVYRFLGTPVDAVRVLEIGTVFTAAVVAACALAPIGQPRLSHALPSGAGEVPRGVVVGALVLGLGGLVLRFPDLESVRSFVAGAYDGLQTTGGALGALSAVLRPLLPVALAVSAVRQRGVARWVLGLLAAVVAVFALGSYGLNRATVIFPALAFLTALVQSGRLRLRPLIVVLGSVVSVLTFAGIGALRGNLYADRIGTVATTGSAFGDFLQTVMIYGQSPLQSAPAISAAAGSHLWSPQSFLASLLSPVPGVPDDLRARSGLVLYNNVLYQNSFSKDQIIPTWLESWLSFGWAGVVVAGVAIGIAIMLLDRVRRDNRSLLGAYAAVLATIWVAQASINSFTGVEQGLLYFAVVPALVSRWLSRRKVHTPDE